MMHRVLRLLVLSTSLTVGLIALLKAQEPASVTSVSGYWTPSAIAILVAAVGVVLVNLYSARTARLVAISETRKAIAPMEQKINELSPVVTKIESHVNSEKTRDQGVIASQKEQLRLMRETIDEMRKERALHEQARVVADTAKAAASAAKAGATTPPKLDRRKDDSGQS